MYIDTNTLPEDFNAADFIKKWQMNKKLFPTDPYTGTITTTNTITSGQFSVEVNPLDNRLKEMEHQMEMMKLDLKFSRLKILALEGKFTQEEITNIRKMLMSKDEASRTLADSIIENA